jgi:hypothetical protein
MAMDADASPRILDALIKHATLWSPVANKRSAALQLAN